MDRVGNSARILTNHIATLTSGTGGAGSARSEDMFMSLVMDTEQRDGQHWDIKDGDDEPYLHEHDQAMYNNTDDPRDIRGPGGTQCSEISGDATKSCQST